MHSENIVTVREEHSIIPLTPAIMCCKSGWFICVPQHKFNKLRNLLFLWIMRPLMQHLSAYTRRTKLLARKENESRYSPELPRNHRDLQLRQ